MVYYEYLIFYNKLFNFRYVICYSNQFKLKLHKKSFSFKYIIYYLFINVVTIIFNLHIKQFKFIIQ